MAFRISTPIAAIASFLIVGSPLVADTIQLVNGDRLKGKVTSLDDQQVVLNSESFGELKIPRGKVELISLGDKGIPDFQQVIAPQQLSGGSDNGQPLGNMNNLSPLLQDPAVQQQLGPMIEQLLGPNGGRDTQQNIEKTRQGLHDLRKDFGDGPEGKALDAYIRFYEQIAPLGNLAQQKRVPAKGRRIPQSKPAEPSKPADPSKAPNKPADANKPADSKSSEEPKKPAEPPSANP